jgi:hypothetical protein
MIGPLAGAEGCRTQLTTLRGREGIRLPDTDLTGHLSGFFLSEIERST